MKAYKISCGDDDHGQQIRFANRGSDLKGSCPDACDGNCTFVELSVKRAPEFDKYAPGPVVIANYLAEGWYWNCERCDHQCMEGDGSVVISSDVVWCEECAVKAGLEMTAHLNG